MARYLLITLLLLAVTSQARPAELLLNTGASFGTGGEGPVVGLNIALPNHLLFGATFWGHTQWVASNGDLHAGLQACRGRLCGFAGAAFLEHTDWLDGSRWNFAISLSWHFDLGRAQSVDLFHLSNAGMRLPNYGRNAGWIAWRIAGR